MFNSISVDIGGTKITCAKINSEFHIIEHVNINTQPTLSGTQILSRIYDVLLEMLDKDTIGIGIGSAGQISNDGVVLSATDTFKDWVGMNLRDYFNAKSNLPIFVVNDVQAMLLGLDLPNDNETVTVAVAIGTGVGGAFSIGNRLIHGHRGTSGELGHLILEPNGHLCPCGNRGCAEAYLSGPAIEKNYGFSSCDAKQLLLENRQMVQSYLEYLCIYLTSITNQFSPQRIVLSGGVAQSLLKHQDFIQNNVRDTVLKSNSDVIIEVDNSNNKLMLIGLAKHVILSI